MGSGERAQAKTATTQQGKIADTQTELGRQLTGLGVPWLKTSGDYWKSVIEGGAPLERAVAPQINTASAQYTQALKSMKESLPPGGQRDRALRDWQIARAGTMSNIYSGGVNDALNRLASVGSDITGQGMGGYGSASAGYGNVANTYAQMASGKAGAAGGLGTGAGMMTAETIGAIAA